MASLLYTPPGFITVERGFGGECFGLRHLCLAGFEGATLDFIDHFVTDTDWKLVISASQKSLINCRACGHPLHRGEDQRRRLGMLNADYHFRIFVHSVLIILRIPSSSSFPATPTIF